MLHYDVNAFDFALNEFLNGNDTYLKSFQSEISNLRSEFYKMRTPNSNNIATVLLGDYLSTLSNSHLLEENEPSSKKNLFIKEIEFLNSLLTKIEGDLGENTILWYKELSNENSKTSKNIKEQLQRFYFPH